jgi:(1->4)-alpha-D-glucan 1-alpha-D-glucosylmutase
MYPLHNLLMSELQECIDRVVHSDARAPISTYRVQMHSAFTFADAEQILPYLEQLGISDLYSSPIFEARSGSQHGYDVTRHDRLNPELGGTEGFNRLSAALRSAAMGLLLDIVPNHMGVGNDSVWWQDVLENGRASEYATFFDIDWDPLKPDMRGKLLLPILGKQYGEELEGKNIQVAFEDGHVRIHYYDHSFPVAPRTIPPLFPEEDDAKDGVPQSLRDLLKELAHIPPHDTSDPNLAAQRREQLKELMPRLRKALLSPELQPILQRVVDRVNGVEGDPKSFDLLHALLEAQPYRLAYWRVSSEEINYRRFFDVNDLAGLRMEDPAAFAQTHFLVRKLLAKQQVTGLRIDHCDGMFNPRQYLIRLQLLYVASQCSGEDPKEPRAANGIELEIRDALRHYDWARSEGPLYTVVEKILEPREALPREWPVRGTTGYDFLHLANHVFIQPQNESRFTALYAKILGREVDPDELIYQCKLRVMQSALSSEVYVLTNLLNQLATGDRRARDFTESILEAVIRETIACFPVYRTYIDDRGQYTDRDIAFIAQAIWRAKYRNPEIDGSAFDFLQNTLLLGDRNDEKHRARLYFALKFQQLTGPVMAKGVEDTAFYVYTRFLSSNEVGSSLKAFGISTDLFHASNQDRVQISPDSMLATSTHDTKRSEDVRNRLNVLSEMPTQWSSLVRRWIRMNARHKQKLADGRIAPDANEEYLIYQAIVGAWPWQMETVDDRSQFLERIKQYCAKAFSEAKVNLSWTNPNPAYLEAVNAFLTSILMPQGRARETRFVDMLKAFLPTVQLFGAVNSLSQLVLKITSPGVPDFYQGTDLWDLSLVDPDNRRPVDYAHRAQLLQALRQQSDRDGAAAVCADVLRALPDGRIKLWTMHRALTTRRELHPVFRHGEYIPLNIELEKNQNALAYLRQDRTTKQSVVVVAPRFACSLAQAKPNLPLGDIWGKALLSLPDQTPMNFLNTFTGKELQADESGRLKLRDILADFPVAILASKP